MFLAVVEGGVVVDQALSSLFEFLLLGDALFAFVANFFNGAS